MPNIRNTSMKKYNISPHRYMELYHFCLQYPEWQDEIKYKTDTVKSIQITDMPMTHGGISDPTQDLAVRLAGLMEASKIIEDTAAEAGEEIGQYILKAVTTEGCTYHYLRTVCNIPCGKNMYYERRKKFFWLLDRRVRK